MYRMVLILLAVTGCGVFGGDQGTEAADAARAQMKAGDIPAAAAALETAAGEYPESLDAATGAAMAALLRGDTDAADAHLARVQDEAGERKSEVLVRRAMIAQQAKDYDKMRQYGEASGMAQGLLLAGEAALVDGEREDAVALLERVVGGGAEDTAKAYLRLLSNDDPVVAGLSEAQALWALGLRKVAVKSVGELLVLYPESEGDRNEQLLVWSSRAASVRETETARKLLGTMSVGTADEQWRKGATVAIVACADGNGKECIRSFERIEADAPPDGLADAKVTAATLIATDDPQTAKDLVGEFMSEGAGRALWKAGARRMAKKSTPAGPLLSFMESEG
jgi:tetratricopeptide (TPR) repeat protein